MSENQVTNTHKDAYKNITSHHSVRKFSDHPISDESLNHILRAGRWSGSSKNVQPWQFIVIRDRETLRRLSECGNFAGHLPSAQAAIAIVIDPVRFAVFDAGRTAQNMMLAAWAEGIGSAMATMHNQACAKQVLLVPDDKEVQIVLDFGYPAPEAEVRRSTPGTARKPLDEIVHWEHW
jgi:nitroreductase